MTDAKTADKHDSSPIEETAKRKRRTKKLLRKIFPYRVVKRPLSKKEIEAEEEAKHRAHLPDIPVEFAELPRGQYGLHKLIKDYDFKNVLDVGSGSGEHAAILHKHNKDVTALDFGVSLYANEGIDESSWTKITGNFYDFEFPEKFDCIWASHVLEHQSDPGVFIRRCRELVKEDGYIAITVPPLKHIIVGGHLTLWNAGLLLYQLVFNGIDCKDAAILTYDYNITIIVQNKARAEMHLDWDYGDIKRLKPYFPDFIDEPFEGQINRWNW